MDNMNEIYEKALGIAVIAHRGQVDKMGMPYILHPLAVAEKVESLDLKTIAVLHDVLEDTKVTKDYLEKAGIPANLISVVEVLTKKDGETYDAYIKRVKKNLIASEVKLADLEHNTDPSRANGLNAERKVKYEKAIATLKG